MLRSVDFSITPKTTDDDATDWTSVDGDCCSSVDEKLDNPRREHSQQLAKLVQCISTSLDNFLVMILDHQMNE